MCGDTKGVIRIRISKKNRHNNGQKKEKVQKDKQRSTKHTYTTKDWLTRTLLKTGCELRCIAKENYRKRPINLISYSYVEFTSPWAGIELVHFREIVNDCVRVYWCSYYYLTLAIIVLYNNDIHFALTIVWRYTKNPDELKHF